jgi:hypothetical protein
MRMGVHALENTMYVCLFIYLFIYGLFKEAANSSGFIQLKDGLISKLMSCK